MSLLLDALNRASKEKAMAASGAAGLAVPPALLLRPELVLETNTHPESKAVSSVPDWPNLALTPEPELKPPTAVEAPFVPSPRPPERPEPFPSAPVISPPEPIKAPTLNLEAPEFTLTGTKPPPDPLPPKAVVRPVPPTPTLARVAQEIQRAKAPAAVKRPPTRRVVLGGVAILLGLGLFSVLSGWWGDPLAWFSPTSQSTLTPPGTVLVAAAAPTTEPLPEMAAVVAAPVVAMAPAEQAKPPALTREIAPKQVARVSPLPKEEIIEPTVKVAQGPETKIAPKKEVASIQRRSVGPSALELGYDALTQGRLKEASQAYTQALVSNPEERDALLGLAYIAHQQGKDDEASAYYKRVLRQDPSNAVAQAGLIALDARGDRQDSASRARDVVEQNPKSAAAQSMLGHSLVQENRLADAQQAFYQAHILEPAVASHAFNLAVALDRMRNYASAQRYYALALSLSLQSGGERASHVPHAAVQARLDQLRSQPAADSEPTLSQ